MTSYTRMLAATVSIFVMLFGLAACGEKDQPGSVPAGGELGADYNQKAQDLEMALRDDPGNYGTLVQLGNTYYDWGQAEVQNKGQMAEPVSKWTRAVDYYQRALAIKSDDVNVRVDRANLLHFMGRGDEAIAEYRMAKNIDPKHPQARINLIVTLADAKEDYAGAVKEYDELIKAIPEMDKDLGLKAEVEKYREAMKEAKK